MLAVQKLLVTKAFQDSAVVFFCGIKVDIRKFSGRGMYFQKFLVMEFPI